MFTGSVESHVFMYLCTRYMAKSPGKLSDIFYTYSGIKRGAPSFVILFIIFMDDIIDVLKEKCKEKLIIRNAYYVLHADNTMIMSQDYNQFIRKCNVLVNTFHKK